MMNRFLLILLLTLITATNPFYSFAQFDREDDKPKMRLKDRIFFGGGVQLSFGSVTAVGASPIVGFRVTEKWSVGVGANYVYYKVKFPNNTSYQTSIYGGSVFTRYTVWKTLFAHAEYGITNWEVPRFDPAIGTYTISRINVPSLLLGGGYAQPIGRNSYFEILALYDVLYDPINSFSASPLTFRAGVNIGF